MISSRAAAHHRRGGRHGRRERCAQAHHDPVSSFRSGGSHGRREPVRPRTLQSLRPGDADHAHPCTLCRRTSRWNARRLWTTFAREVLSSDRLNVVVFGVFAGVALLIAVVGVAGVLAFSVSGRTREFGIRLAVGSQPRNLLLRVIAEGAAMAIGGLAVGLACGYGLAQLAGTFLGDLKMPGVCRWLVRLWCCCLPPCRVGDPGGAGRPGRRDAGAAIGLIVALSESRVSRASL